MVKVSSLVKGIGNLEETQKYYDEWSSEYEYTLNKWKYSVPKKAINLLQYKLRYEPKRILDLACGTGLFGEELIKVYKKSQIYGSDISKKSLIIANQKKIYKKLSKFDFEKKQSYKSKFNLVSMIGAMTYCKNFDKLFNNVKDCLFKKGNFIFSHRTDLWNEQNFNNILDDVKINFRIKYISKPTNYLPLNKDFLNKIRIRLVLLEKK